MSRPQIVPYINKIIERLYAVSVTQNYNLPVLQEILDWADIKKPLPVTLNDKIRTEVNQFIDEIFNQLKGAELSAGLQLIYDKHLTKLRTFLHMFNQASNHTEFTQRFDEYLYAQTKYFEKTKNIELIKQHMINGFVPPEEKLKLKTQQDDFQKKLSLFHTSKLFNPKMIAFVEDLYYLFNPITPYSTDPTKKARSEMKDIIKKIKDVFPTETIILPWHQGTHSQAVRKKRIKEHSLKLKEYVDAILEYYQGNAAQLVNKDIVDADFFFSQFRAILVLHANNTKDDGFLKIFDKAFSKQTLFPGTQALAKDGHLVAEAKEIEDIIQQIIKISQQDEPSSRYVLIKSNLDNITDRMNANPELVNETVSQAFAKIKPLIENLAKQTGDDSLLMIFTKLPAVATKTTPSDKATVMTEFTSLVDNKLPLIAEKIKKTKHTMFKSTIDKNVAAARIQKAWRLSKINKKIRKSALEVYRGTLNAQKEIQCLAELMYGTTIAPLRDERAPFYIRRYSPWGALDYHRSDPLFEVTRKFAPRLTEYGAIEINKHYYAGDYEYFPITLLASLPIETIIDRYASDRKDFIKVLKKDNENLAFIEAKKGRPETEVGLESVFRSAGVISSPWMLATAYAKDQANNTTNAVVMDPDIEKLLAAMPTTWEALKQSDLMTKLSRMAVDRHAPTHVLAAALYRLIDNLAGAEIPAQIIQRIAMFLEIGELFYQNNYERFVFIVYTIVQEISFVLHQNMTAGKPLIDFAAFKKDVCKNVLPHFGGAFMHEDESSAYQSVAIPAASGMNSLALAMHLARKMQTASGDTTIKVLDQLYYEFMKIEKDTAVDDADIYVIHMGPMLDESTLRVGTDINRVVRDIFANRKPMRPVTLVADATTCLYKNFKLDDDVKSYIDNGMLSIIVAESHQKFGLLHTDQAQYGRVYGICSKKSFSAEVIAETESNASLDLSRNIDMQIGAYINVHAGHYLELIKQRHFKNGATLRDFLTKYFLVTQIATQPNMLEEAKETYFVGLEHDGGALEKQLAEITKRHFWSRDSFGHAQSTLSMVNPRQRICANASDSIDSLIDAGTLYFGGLANVNLIKQILQDLIQVSMTQNLSLQEQITSTAALLALKAKGTRFDFASLYLYNLGVNQLIKNSAALAGREKLSSLNNYHDTLTKILHEDHENTIYAKLDTIIRYMGHGMNDDEKNMYATVLVYLEKLQDIFIGENANNGIKSILLNALHDIPFLSTSDFKLTLAVMEALSIFINTDSPIPGEIIALLAKKTALAETFAKAIIQIDLAHPNEAQLLKQFCEIYQTYPQVDNIVLTLSHSGLLDTHILPKLFDFIHHNSEIEPEILLSMTLLAYYPPAQAQAFLVTMDKAEKQQLRTSLSQDIAWQNSFLKDHLRTLDLMLNHPKKYANTLGMFAANVENQPTNNTAAKSFKKT